MILPHRRSASRPSGSFLVFLFMIIGANAVDQHAFPVVPSKLQQDSNLSSSVTGFLLESQTKPEIFDADNSTSNKPPNSSFLVRAMQEQLESAKEVASMARFKKHPRFLRELHFQIRENEQALGASVVDAELPHSARRKMEALRQVLSRATVWHGRCEETVKRLRSSVMVIEDKVSLLSKVNNDLGRLAARTVPKGFHCLALQLTIQYYNEVGGRISQDFSKTENSGLMHYVIYTENILAATVIINSTVCSAKEPHQHVFHVLTDDLNHAAFESWFQRNTPGKASVEIKSLENFHTLHLPSNVHNKSRKDLELPRPRAQLKQEENVLTHRTLYLYFALPRIFPKLEKVLVLDDDIVVQRDLSHLWQVDLDKKVVGAVGSCETSSDLGGMLGWACMNMVDLGEWRRQGLSEILELDQDMGDALTLIRESKTYEIDETACHVMDLGDNPSKWVNSTHDAAAVHYRGYAKPWLGVAMNRRYRDLWTRFVNYENPLLQACNIHN